jgi:biopolymer transport protein ExbB/TolQ
MYPIAVVAALGFAIAIERLFALTRALTENRRDFEKLMLALKAGQMKEVLEATRTPTTGVAHMLGEAMRRLPHSRRRADLEMAMEEALLEVLPTVERRTPYLASFANVATLLGLLGTVVGLIDAFTSVGEADAAQKAAMLSAAISIAMNATAFGLMTAIPLLLAHTYLQARTVAITESLEIAQVKFLNQLEMRLDLGAGMGGGVSSDAIRTGAGADPRSAPASQGDATRPPPSRGANSAAA